MTRRLPTFVAAVALLALPGCTGWVIVEGPLLGLFSVRESPPDQAGAQAFFYKYKATTGGPIEVDRDGACWLDHFDPPLPGSNPNKPVLLDAGRLRVAGAHAVLVASFTSGRYDFPEKSSIFEAGDVLTLEVEGSDEVAPMSATLSAPPVPMIAPPPETIDIGEDLTFTWESEPGTGTLAISVTGFWPAVQIDSTKLWGPRDIVRCTADLSEGTLTMPASLLSQVSDDGPVGASVNAHVFNRDIRHAGDSLVTFDVTTGAVATSGEAYQFNAELK